eukprot:scaffold8893_cov84-Cylindrotheca_fusiformis.AAC.3
MDAACKALWLVQCMLLDGTIVMGFPIPMMYDGIAARQGGRRSQEVCAVSGGCGENHPLQAKAHAPNWSTAFGNPMRWCMHYAVAN